MGVLQAQTAPAGNIDNGKKLWVKDNCYTCHGYDGHGGAGARLAPKPIPLAAFMAIVRHPPASSMPTFSEKVIPDSDLRDMWAYLRTIKPSAQPNKEHDLWFIFGWRWLVTIWKWFFFTPGAFANDPNISQLLNRGAYLVQALGHCSECHTPRNFLGGFKSGRFLAGGKGPDGKNVPNLTPTKLSKWSDSDLKDFLTTGVMPDGDIPAESMGEVIRNTTSQWMPGDLAAVMAYLRSLPAL